MSFCCSQALYLSQLPPPWPAYQQHLSGLSPPPSKQPHRIQFFQNLTQNKLLPSHLKWINLYWWSLSLGVARYLPTEGTSLVHRFHVWKQGFFSTWTWEAEQSHYKQQCLSQGSDSSGFTLLLQRGLFRKPDEMHDDSVLRRQNKVTLSIILSSYLYHNTATDII